MSQSHILVVVIDGLRASALGAYGNTIYPTPALDRFAADSLLFDACFAPAVDLRSIYRSLWQSSHPLRPQPHTGTASLFNFATHQSYETTLLSDDQTVLSLEGAESFARRCQLEPPTSATSNGELPWNYQAFGALAAEIESGNATDFPQFLWFHGRGLYGRWDAPLDLQEILRDEGDPPPLPPCDSPTITLAARDSDTAFQYSTSYAAQIMVLDECWRVIEEALRENPNSNWLVALLGARGFPLGEHGHIGGEDQRLYIEQLHVPLLLRFPDGRGRLLRRPELVSPLDLAPTLSDWIRATDKPEQDNANSIDGRSLLPLAAAARVPWREALLATSPQAQSLRTPEWSLRTDLLPSAPTSQPHPELYVRPDDRHESNDIAIRCPDVVAELVKLTDCLAGGYDKPAVNDGANSATLGKGR